MMLNLGCGGHVAPEPWVNVDRSLGNKHFPCHPDVVADVSEGLPFDDDSVDAIYCGHLLEHIDLDRVVPALREMRRVLKPGGRLCVVGPDFDRATKLANKEEDMRPAIWPGIAGEWNDWPGAGHQWCATGTNSLELIRGVFPEAREIPIAEASADPFWPTVSPLEWQFAVVA